MQKREDTSKACSAKGAVWVRTQDVCWTGWEMSLRNQVLGVPCAMPQSLAFLGVQKGASEGGLVRERSAQFK